MSSRFTKIGSGRFRLFLLLMLLAFSFGGFTFYAAVVVPIGGDVFDATAQGFITRRVTHMINAASALTLAALIWEGFAARSMRRLWENRIYFGCCAIYGVCLTALVLLHPSMDELLDESNFSIDQPAHFYKLHRIYLWTSTAQWISTIVLIWIICQSRQQNKT